MIGNQGEELNPFFIECKHSRSAKIFQQVLIHFI